MSARKEITAYLKKHAPDFYDLPWRFVPSRQYSPIKMADNEITNERLLYAFIPDSALTTAQRSWFAQTIEHAWPFKTSPCEEGPRPGVLFSIPLNLPITRKDGADALGKILRDKYWATCALTIMQARRIQSLYPWVWNPGLHPDPTASRGAPAPEDKAVQDRALALDIVDYHPQLGYAFTDAIRRVAEERNSSFFGDVRGRGA